MKLTVLGVSGSAPGPHSAASGYLVESGSATIVVDLGNGAFGPLQHHIDPFSIDAIVISHLHADHCADLTAVIKHLRSSPHRPADRSTSTLKLYAPGGTIDRLADLYAPSVSARATFDLSGLIDFVELSDGVPFEVADCVVDVCAVNHNIEGFGFRIACGPHVLTYSGDTGPTDRLLSIARDSDLFLCEASWPHSRVPDMPHNLHLSGRQAAEYAAAAGVERLILTHVLPWFDGDEILAEARSAFSGNVSLARPGDIWDTGH